MSMVTIRNDNLEVSISTTGAELQSVKDQNGEERLWQGDPRYWTGRAPILFPNCGGLKDDAYLLQGIRYEMPKHGFARKAEWKVEKEGKDSCTLLLKSPHPGFPFHYELRAEYSLKGNALKVTYRVRNKDKQEFWFSVGSHEAWATPGGLEAYTIEFDQPEKLEDYVLHGNLIAREPVLMAEEETRELALKTEYFAVDALVFPTLKSRSVTLKNNLNEKKIRVDYDGMDVLMLWTKPGAEYICIEPWCNAPDFENAEPDIEKKPGYMQLKPGKEIKKTHTITVI